MVDCDQLCKMRYWTEDDHETLQGKYMCLSSFQSLSHVWLFVTPWIAAHQASLSSIISWSFLKLMYTESVMPSNHLILCCSLLLLPSIFPSIRISSKADFSRVSCLHQVAEYWSFSFSISPSNEYSGLISFRIGSFDLRVVQGILICYILQMLYVTYNTYNIIYNIHIEYVTYPYI